VQTSPESRTAILDGAERLIASQGFSATTIKQIADAANVNTALLYYYFRDKEALYQAVVDRLLDGLIAMGTTALASETDPVAAVRAIIAGQARLLSGTPSWIRILARELLDHEHSRVGEPARRVASTIFAHLCATIRRGQAMGVFRRDLDPRFAAISLVGQQAYFYLAHPAVQVLLESEGVKLDDDTRSAFAAHVADFCLTALRPAHDGVAA
jgi:TetR/AcrR family transcriptional regulator